MSQAQPGERISVDFSERICVDFIMDLPYLHAGFYHFAPAVADGTLDQYEMCDWIDNASAIEVIQRTTTYGHMRIPMSVRAMTVTREATRVL